MWRQRGPAPASGSCPASWRTCTTDLVRLLPGDFAELLPYWMVLRPDSMRRPAVAAVVQALREQTAAHREWLLGHGGRTHRLLRNCRFAAAKRAVTAARRIDASSGS